jgi:deoxyribodipyrimidine photo-lyase
LHDNTALLNLSSNILPIFIFNPKQIHENSYFNARLVRFMIDSLNDLDRELQQRGGKLHCFYGHDVEVLNRINQVRKIGAVWYNQDLTPYASKRDQEIYKWCQELGIPCNSTEDYTFHSVDKVRNKQGGIYQVFTPFKNTCMEMNVPTPRPFQATHCFVNLDIKVLSQDEMDSFTPANSEYIHLKPSRAEALLKLEAIRSGRYRNYAEDRDKMGAENKTTHMATYLKFGLVSCREAYEACVQGNGKDNSLISELYWREFYYHLTFHKPELLQRQISSLENQTLKKRMMAVQWRKAEGSHWEAWCQGNTGFPLVDAAMREMLQTGFMHNRGRMCTAMFLTKNLLMDWRAGEQYLAQHLIDYDPAMNNGGWQWSASTGVDTQPYRIFNIWLQMKRYDPDCQYVKRWIPELKNVPTKDILNWEATHSRYKVYCKPIVEHATSSKDAKAMLKGEDV